MSKENISAFFDAVKTGNVSTINAMVYDMTTTISLECRNGEYNTPLIMAAIMGRVESVRTLLDLGAEINGRNNILQTALHKAVMRGMFDCVKLLLERGADPNLKDDNDRTPLHEALQLDTKVGTANKIIDMLLDHDGILIEGGDMTHGRTPVFYAALQDNVSALKKLIKLGANIHEMDNLNSSAYKICTTYPRQDAAVLLQEVGDKLDQYCYSFLKQLFPDKLSKVNVEIKEMACTQFTFWQKDVICLMISGYANIPINSVRTKFADFCSKDFSRLFGIWKQPVATIDPALPKELWWHIFSFLDYKDIDLSGRESQISVTEDF